MLNTETSRFSLSEWLYRYRRVIVTGIVLLGVGALFYLPRLQFRADFSKFLPEGNPELVFYEQHAATFGDRDDHLAIAIVRSAGVFERDFLQRVAAFADSCRALDLIRRTHSILNLSEVYNTPIGPVTTPFLDLSGEDIFNRDSLRLVNHPLVKGQLLSGDATALVLSIDLVEDPDRAASHALIGRLRELLEAFDFEASHIIGTLNLEVNHIHTATTELFFFIKVCILLIIVVLLIVYRSFAATLLPLLIFLLSLVILGALLALLGITLDTISTMLPAILLIVSISDVIHLFAKMQPYARAERSALFWAIDQVAKTNFLTSLTTAVGFFTLVISPMPTLVDFGVAVGLGVLIAYLLSILLVPITFFLFPFELPAPRGIFAPARWEHFVDKHLLRWIQKPRLVFLGLSFLVLLSLVGISRIDYDRYLVSTMPFGHSVRTSYAFFEEQFAGSREFEIAVTARDPGGLLQLDNLRLIDRLQAYLDSLPVVASTLSTTTYFKVANNSYSTGRKDEYRLPENQAELDRLHRRIPRGIERQFRSVVDSTHTYGTIRGRMHDVGMIEHRKMMAEIDTWIERNAGTDQLSFQHTGIPMLLDTINRLQVEANFVGLLIAAVFISLLIALLYRSGLYIFVVVFGNLLPLILLAGTIGFAGIELRGAISLVFSVAFVIIVDDTIHFLNNFQLKRRNGQDVAMAIEGTLRRTGHAIFLTTLVLTVVTLALTWSSLPDIYYLGILLSVALVLALLFDLVLIPVLLRVVYGNRA